MKAGHVKRIRRDTKRLFLKKGTCSRALFYILDREFGHPQEDEERATELLAGGIVQQGYQCGLLWGAVFAVGAESFRRQPDRDRAIGMAIKAGRHVSASFVARAKSPDCYDITSCEGKDKLNFAKFMLTGKFLACFKLADAWAPEAIQAAKEGLALDPSDLPARPRSCASEVVRLAGGSDAEMVTVAGLAGGIGLSGGGCGALVAAIWMNALSRIRDKTYKSSLSDPVAERILRTFFEAAGSELDCRVITGRLFPTVADHTEFIEGGGCGRLIQDMAGAVNASASPKALS
jgi:hypothetical protein